MAKQSNEVETEDLTGQSRFAWNLMVSWLSQLVLIFSGFVMPRLVDEKIGQVALGIWDFGWAFVGYLTLVGFGMGACFNRYIAKHRAAGEIALLNEVANSVVLVQLVISMIVLIATLCFYALLPTCFASALNQHIDEAQWVVLFLGLSIVVRMLSGSARGLLTGYHRWDIHNALHAGFSLCSLLCMLAALFFTHHGVVGMAFVYLISTLIFESLGFFLVKKICIEFTFNLALARLTCCKEMLRFGIKSMLTNLPPILLLQTINILIVSLIGPSALAIFARPVALTRHIHTFVNKFTFMITPSAGALSASEALPALRKLYLDSTQLSVAFCLPALACLFVYGDTLLYFWMGEDYALWPLVMILSAGQLLSFAQDTSIRILMGVNQHGLISIFAFIAVLLCFVILVGIVGIQDWQLTTAALLLVLPLSLVYGVCIPVYTCLKLSLAYSTYLYHSLCKPLFYLLPYLFLLTLSKIAFCHEQPVIAGGLFLCAVLLTLVIYFRKLLPHHYQRAILTTLQPLRCFMPQGGKHGR